MATDDNIDWDTDEVLDWFLNDEYMYNNRHGSVERLINIWQECDPNGEVDVELVDWYYVEEFFTNN